MQPTIFLPLAFAVTKEVSSDSWRWFLSGIREKVTQRKGLCLISSPHPDILAAIDELGSQWAYHRFCLKQFVQLNDSTCSCGDFQSNKFPCLHALAVCKKLKINPLQYVDDCYTCERYYKTYAATFSPVPRLFPPVIPPSVVPCKSQRKTTPKTTNKRKS
ncbi:hypothetical protein YC2023_014987 [Brassica napus]